MHPCANMILPRPRRNGCSPHERSRLFGWQNHGWQNHEANVSMILPHMILPRRRTEKIGNVQEPITVLPKESKKAKKASLWFKK